MEHLLHFYRSFKDCFIISSRLADGLPLSIADTALLTLALVKPSITKAVVASSAAGFEEG